MSNFKVEVVKLGPVGKHPNADSLGITSVGGQNCIFNLEGNWQEGDLAIYVPAESVVPLDRPYFSWLRKDEKEVTRRVKPMRLRGIYSEGFLIRPSECFDHRSNLEAGQDVTKDLGVVKYVEPESFVMGGENESDPGFMPHYDMEPYFKFKHLLEDSEQVVVTEKIHGCNARFAYVNGRLWVASHGCVKRMDPNNLFWKVAVKYDLEKKLQMFPGIVFFGEIYGQVQDLKYGITQAEGYQLRFFDSFDSGRETNQPSKWFSHSYTKEMVEAMGLTMVPVLYTGPLVRDVVESMRTGKSVLDGGTIREGLVIRPIQERWNQETGRTLFKIVSEEYKLRKKGTEHK